MILWLKHKHLKMKKLKRGMSFNEAENLNRVLVGARDDLDGVQALERPQFREDVPHCHRLREIQDDVPLSWSQVRTIEDKLII